MPLLRTAPFVVLAMALLGATPVSLSTNPIILNANVPLTGGAAFIGKSLQDSFRAAEIFINSTGGIHGRPLKIVAADTQTSGSVGLQLTQDYIAKRVPFYIEGGPSPICNASMPVVAKSGPVQYCLSPAIHPVPNGYVFSASVASADVQRVAIRYFRLRGWKRMAMISATDASGSDLETQTMAALSLPENRDVELVAREKFAPTDLTVAAQISRIQAAKPQAILVWATGTPVATVMRGLNDAGNALPVQVPSSILIYAQLAAYASFLPKELFFTTQLALTPGQTPPGPVRDAQTAYVKAFKAIDARPDAATNLAWDPVMIYADALRHLHPDPTAEEIRDYILHLHGWVGANGVFDFGNGDQRGVGENALDVAQLDNAKLTWVRVSRPRGYLLNTR